MTVEIERYDFNGSPKAFLAELSRSKPAIKSLVVGMVLEDDSLKLHAAFDEEAHLIAIHGALSAFLRRRAQ